jgi:hypothetical protein
MEQLAVARRLAVVDKSQYGTRNTQFCAASSRDSGSQLVEFQAVRVLAAGFRWSSGT